MPSSEATAPPGVERPLLRALKSDLRIWCSSMALLARIIGGRPRPGELELYEKQSALRLNLEKSGGLSKVGPEDVCI